MRLCRIGDVDNHQELVVLGIARDEVARAGRQIGVMPVSEPDIVDAARVRAGGVEMRQLLRMDRIADVIDIDPGVGLTRLLGLVRHDQGVAGEAQRVAAHKIRLDRYLSDDGRRFGLGHVDHAEAHRRRFMSEVEDPLAIRILLQHQPFATLSGAVQVATADDPHVAGLGGGERALGAGQLGPE
jgi:hypothetical protein